MSCIIYVVSCNFATHVTCSLAFMSYKYNELQVSSKPQKLNCKANCKIPLFVIMIITKTLLDFDIFSVRNG
jgi:hypothetical protein